MYAFWFQIYSLYFNEPLVGELSNVGTYWKNILTEETERKLHVNSLEIAFVSIKSRRHQSALLSLLINTAPFPWEPHRLFVVYLLFIFYVSDIIPQPSHQNIEGLLRDGELVKNETKKELL